VKIVTFVRNTTAAIAAVSAGSLSGVHGKDKPKCCSSAKCNAKKPWKMKLATSSVMFGKLPFEQVCQRVERLGLSGLDIWPPFDRQCSHMEEIKKRLGGKGLKELMAKHKLEVAAFTIYHNKLSQYWEMIRDYGGGIVVRSAGAGKMNNPKDLMPRMRKFFEDLKPEIELAEKCNARLAIENYVNKGDVLSSPDSFKAFVELNPNPKRVGIAFAPYHLQEFKTPIEDVIKIAESQCLFLYAWQRAKDVGQMPGVGPTDFTPWLGALAEIKYQNYLSIFMHGHQPEDKMEADVAKSRDYLINCRKKALSL